MDPTIDYGRTVYEEEEFAARIAIIADELGLIYPSQNKFLPRERLVREAYSWAYVLDRIPTERLGAAFRRAGQEWDGDGPMTSSSVKRAYQEILDEQRVELQPNHITSLAQGTPLALPSPDRMSDVDLEKEREAIRRRERAQEDLEFTRKWIRKKLDGLWPAHWFKGPYQPWDLYPTSVERCVTLDFPEIDCPGYVIRHDVTPLQGTPEGHVTHKILCPLHPFTWDGVS